MTRVPRGGMAGFDADDADPDEDTIEMVLTPAELRLLNRAADEQQRAASIAESTPNPPTTDSILPSMPSQMTSAHSSASLARGALAGVAAAFVIIVAIASLSGTRLTTDMKSSPPPRAPGLAAAVTAARSTAESPSPAVTEPQPLRFKNPFDKSEIFEFPPGTTPEAARASVANLLMQRAQGRHIRPGLQHYRVNGAAPRRSAKQAELAQTSKRG